MCDGGLGKGGGGGGAFVVLHDSYEGLKGWE